ncbi:MAG: prephenate dehydratase [Thermodesulfobacteriota bacterium]
METKGKINLLREKIDLLDEQMLSLLNQRAALVKEIGQIKNDSQINTYDYQREEAIISRLQSKNNGPFPNSSLPVVFREIISACRSLEGNLIIAYLGPPATHTHLACLEKFGAAIQTYPLESIPEVFESVERGKAHYGIVPVENSTEGIVGRTLDMFIDSEAKICGEVLMRISHDLLSSTGEAAKVKKIYSHPQALAQCRQWLRKNFPHAELRETLSTAKAAQMATTEEDAAAVASSFAAQMYGLKIIEAGIEDYRHNYTRFLVLGKSMNERTGQDKTSLLFSITDAPGALFAILKPFAEKNINLTKIESRPIKNKPWEYIFFLDFEGHAADDNIQATLSELKSKVLFYKLLGSYPRSS